MGRKVVAAMNGDAYGKTVAVLGLTFKPNTDDMRDSPAIAIIQALQDAGAKIKAYDPKGTEQAKLYLENVEYMNGPYDAVDGADALVIITEWDVFRGLDLDRIHMLLKTPILVDLRNIYPRSTAEVAGFTYHSIGR